jgi:hypothetical protein
MRGVMLTILCGSLLVACSGGTSQPTASDAGSGWQAVADVSVLKGASIYDVIPSGSGFMVVGSVNESGHTVAAIWTSPDGSSWTRAPSNAAYTDAAFIGVAPWQGGYIAAGYACPSGGECGGSGAIWSSADGSTWTMGQPVNANYRVQSLATDGTRIVALANSMESGAGMAFLSTDGSNWTQSGSASLALATLSAVTISGSGAVMAGAKSGKAAVWTSPDGSKWTGATGTAFSQGELRGVASSGGLTVAVGRDSAGAAAWASSDASTWQRTTDDADFSGAVMDAVAIIGSTAVAVGKDPTGAAMWTSSDGLTWTRVTLGSPVSGGQLTHIAVSGSKAVVIGIDDAYQPVVFVSTVGS